MLLVALHVHVHVAVPANSPFWQGRDTGLASAPVPIFGAFPRVGIPRAFGSYAEYVEAADVALGGDPVSPAFDALMDSMATDFATSVREAQALTATAAPSPSGA